MKKLIILFLFVAAISSCSTGNVVDVKSPCVSNDNGPCGPKKPINDWWLNNNNNNNNTNS